MNIIFKESYLMNNILFVSSVYIGYIMHIIIVTHSSYYSHFAVPRRVEG